MTPYRIRRLSRRRVTTQRADCGYQWASEPTLETWKRRPLTTYRQQATEPYARPCPLCGKTDV